MRYRKIVLAALGLAGLATISYFLLKSSQQPSKRTQRLIQRCHRLVEYIETKLGKLGGGVVEERG